MFTSLFFLILFFMLSTQAFESNDLFLFDGNYEGLLIAVLLYLPFLLFIYYQTRWLNKIFYRRREAIAFIANLEILAFFSVIFFIFGAQKPFGTFIWGKPVLFILSLFLYFVTLGCSRYSYERLTKGKSSAKSQTLSNLRFLIPFTFPVLIYMFFETLTQKIYSENEILISNLFFFALIIIFMPALMIWTWGCQPLRNPELLKRFELVCRKGNFKHGGFKIWGIMENHLTAAIIGITKKFRYILFTQLLIDSLSINALEAILAHEIGHSYRKHLLIYPLILFGMLISASLLSELVYPFAAETISSIFNLKISPYMGSQIFFFLFIVAMAIYFRFIFGFFSRLFERQADLHVFELNIPSEFMIEALHSIGTASGTHKQPSWHHYSIEERINFLKIAQSNPVRIAQHHRKVKFFLTVYIFAFLLNLLYFNFQP